MAAIANESCALQGSSCNVSCDATFGAGEAPRFQDAVNVRIWPSDAANNYSTSPMLDYGNGHYVNTSATIPLNTSPPYKFRITLNYTSSHSVATEDGNVT